MLVDAFRTGQDVHVRTAMEIFGVDAADNDAVVQGTEFHGYFLRHAPVLASLYVLLALVL